MFSLQKGVLFVSQNWNKTPAKHRDIFRDTVIAEKYGEGEDRTHDLLAGKHKKHSSTSPGSNPRPSGWESDKWSALHSMEWRWSGVLAEFI